MVDAREYHEQTKHSPHGVRRDTFSLDYASKPRPYKIYESLPRVTPPTSPQSPATPMLSAIATRTANPNDRSDRSPIDINDIYSVCHYATGVTKELSIQGRQQRFRAASCTGKLYHIDLYAVTGDVDGLDAGVYHFDPDSGAFDVLRTGEYRDVLARAAGTETAVSDAPVTFIATSEWWRNAWKYRERTYRHAFWDAGTIIANLLAVAHGGDYQAAVVAGFADDLVTTLLGIDPAEEAPISLIPVGHGAPVSPPDMDSKALDAIDPIEVPVSERTVEYPLISDAWYQSQLDEVAVHAWRTRCETTTWGADRGDGETVILDPVDAETASSRPIGATIDRRGSLREYSHDAISSRMLATVLDRALRGMPTDCFGSRGIQRLVDCYCLIHAVRDIPSGIYQYHPDATALERLGETDRSTAGYLALDQPVVGDSAVNVYLTANIDAIVERLGNRGYRLAQLAGGIGLGRLYLAVYAHRTLGGRGFTFYDDLVTEHLSPRASNQTPMTLFAFGRPDK